MERRADGYFYYYTNKTVPIGNITACATDAANPRKRTNTGPPDEKLYTFKLSVLPTCDRDGKSYMSLNVKQEQARPRTRAHTALCLLARSAPSSASD